MNIDIVATELQYLQHVLPIAEELKDRMGTLYLSDELYDQLYGEYHPAIYLQRISTVDVNTFNTPAGSNPILAASSGDMTKFINGWGKYKRPTILMEHGVGITYGTDHPSYAGSKTGLRSKIDLFLAPNRTVADKTEKVLPDKEQFIIGTPKLDKFFGQPSGTFARGPIVVISFHWEKKPMVAPEAGNALAYYHPALEKGMNFDNFPLLLNGWIDKPYLAGHGHPRIREKLERVYEKLGIQTQWDFDYLMRVADLYVCDNSSTIYEWCVTGKPVLLLNAPHFRKNVNFGIRFWDYTDIGPQCEGPGELEDKIIEALETKDKYKEAREKVVHDLFPNFGSSARVAADYLKWRF